MHQTPRRSAATPHERCPIVRQWRAAAPSAIELSERYAQALRDLAAVTDPEDRAPGLRFPGDVYLVLGLLARARRDLPGVLAQLHQWLAGQVGLGVVEGFPALPIEGQPETAGGGLPSPSSPTPRPAGRPTPPVGGSRPTRHCCASRLGALAAATDVQDPDDFAAELIVIYDGALAG